VPLAFQWDELNRIRFLFSPIVSSNNSSVLASRKLTLSPSALMSLTRLNSLQSLPPRRRGVLRPPLWPTRFFVYASPVLFTCATVSRPLATLSVIGATLYTGGWLALTSNLSDCPPGRDLHAARSAMLCLAH